MRNAVWGKDTNRERRRARDGGEKVERDTEEGEGLIPGLGLENLTDLLWH